jgi:HAD superfamily hydrolase (TIGR01549 family)
LIFAARADMLCPVANHAALPAATMNHSAAHRFPRAILFDLDDTLWPIAPVIAAAELRLFGWLQANAPGVAERFSIDRLRQRRMQLLALQPHYQRDLGALRRAVLHAAFAEAGEDGAKVEAAMVEFFAARNRVTPYDDVLPGLQALRQLPHGLLLGSVSNGNADLQAIGMAHHFQVSLAAASFGVAKPQPAIFLAACAALGVAPHEAVYVGDDILLDVRGAQQAGLQAVWLRRGDSSAHLEHGVTPDAICADLHQLVAWLAPAQSGADGA